MNDKLLTFSFQKNNDQYFIHLPVNNLIEPVFQLDNDTLSIFPKHKQTPITIENLTPDIIKAILDKKAFIVESLVYDNRKSILIVI